MKQANQSSMGVLPAEISQIIVDLLLPYDLLSFALTTKTNYDTARTTLAKHKAGFAQFDRRRCLNNQNYHGLRDHRHIFWRLLEAAENPHSYFYAQELVLTLHEYDEYADDSECEGLLSTLATYQQKLDARDYSTWPLLSRCIRSSGVLQAANVSEDEFLSELFSSKFAGDVAASVFLRLMPNLKLLRIAARQPLDELTISQVRFLEHVTILEVPTFDQYRGELDPIESNATLLELPRLLPALKVLRTRAVAGGDTLLEDDVGHYTAHPLRVTTFQLRQSFLEEEEHFNVLLKPMSSLKRFEYELHAFEAALAYRGSTGDLLAPMNALYHTCAETLEFLSLKIDDKAAESPAWRKTRDWSDANEISPAVFPRLHTLIVDTYLFTHTLPEHALMSQGETNWPDALMEDPKNDDPFPMLGFLPPSLETLVVHCTRYYPEEVMQKRLSTLFAGLKLPARPDQENERTARLPLLKNITLLLHDPIETFDIGDCLADLSACGVKVCDSNGRPGSGSGPEPVEKQIGWDHHNPETLDWPPGDYTL